MTKLVIKGPWRIFVSLWKQRGEETPGRPGGSWAIEKCRGTSGERVKSAVLEGQTSRGFCRKIGLTTFGGATRKEE